MTLVLFDIDGTLVRGAPPVHRQALCDAAQAVFGVAMDPMAFGPTDGMTDRAIFRRELRAVGVADEAITTELAALCVAAADAYDRLAPDDLRRYHTPHAETALDWLLARGATLGLVTGNIERVAWRKLAAAGLAERFLQPAAVVHGATEDDTAVVRWIGGFGDQAEDRADLPPLALHRASRLLGVAPDPQRAWLIGDTPADIACGQPHAVRAIAVATGAHHSLADLLACKPAAALRDLGELPALRALLFAEGRDDLTP